MTGLTFGFWNQNALKVIVVSALSSYGVRENCLSSTAAWTPDGTWGSNPAAQCTVKDILGCAGVCVTKCNDLQHEQNDYRNSSLTFNSESVSVSYAWHWVIVNELLFNNNNNKTTKYFLFQWFIDWITRRQIEVCSQPWYIPFWLPWLKPPTDWLTNWLTN